MQKPDDERRAFYGGFHYGANRTSIAVGSMPSLWQQIQDKGLFGYDSCQFPAILPQVQNRDPNQCRKTKNGRKQMSQTIYAEPASHLHVGGRLFLFDRYSIVVTHCR